MKKLLIFTILCLALSSCAPITDVYPSPSLQNVEMFPIITEDSTPLSPQSQYEFNILYEDNLLRGFLMTVFGLLGVWLVMEFFSQIKSITQFTDTELTVFRFVLLLIPLTLLYNGLEHIINAEWMAHSFVIGKQ